MRAWKCASPPSGFRANTKMSGAQLDFSVASHFSMRTRDRLTASTERNGTIRKGSPHETVCGAIGEARMSSASIERMSASIPRLGAGGPVSASFATENCANGAAPSPFLTVTGMGPTPSSSTSLASPPD